MHSSFAKLKKVGCCTVQGRIFNAYRVSYKEAFLCMDFMEWIGHI